MKKITLKNRPEDKMQHMAHIERYTPPYQSQDIGCSCNDEGFKSAWSWVYNGPEECYRCRGCGEMH